MTEGLPTTLNIDGLDREVVTAIYALPLYGSRLATWMCVVRWERAVPGVSSEFLVFTVVQRDDGTYYAESKEGSYDIRKAHTVAWRRAASRYGLPRY